MSQSNPEMELPEMSLPPKLPPDEVSAVEWPPMQEFASQKEAFDWAFYQNKAGGPKYFVQRLAKGKWEAIQAWISNL